MSFLDAILPTGPPEPCPAPAATTVPYSQAGTDAWVARCEVCGGKVKYDVEDDAVAAAERHDATGLWEPSG